MDLCILLILFRYTCAADLILHLVMICFDKRRNRGTVAAACLFNQLI